MQFRLSVRPPGSQVIPFYHCHSIAIVSRSFRVACAMSQVQDFDRIFSPKTKHKRKDYIPVHRPLKHWHMRIFYAGMEYCHVVDFGWNIFRWCDDNLTQLGTRDLKISKERAKKTTKMKSCLLAQKIKYRSIEFSNINKCTCFYVSKSRLKEQNAHSRHKCCTRVKMSSSEWHLLPVSGFGCKFR